MVAYSFKAQFVPLVEQGLKTKTIRGHRKRHAKPGEAIQLYTGMRTSACRKLRNPDPICKAITPIQIDLKGITLDRRLLTKDEAQTLAKADGFTSLEEMLLFFQGLHGLPFTGYLIEWQI